jgi:hypothetical protein
MPFIYFFDDCCMPLFEESLEDHYRSHHVTTCHKVKLASLKDYFSHHFQKHFLELLSVVSTEVLQLFYSLTASNAPRLNWHAISPIMLFPQVENPYLPSMYSLEMYHLLQTAYKTTNVFLTTLRPSNYSDELKCKLIDFSQVAAIWVGQKNSASEFTPYWEKYQILNLTNAEDTTRVPTGYLSGHKVILKDRGTHVTKFCSLITYLTELVAFLPQSYHQPIMVAMNFEPEQLLHMEVAVVSIVALVAQLDLLRKRYCVPIVLVGALPRYLSRSTEREYKAECRTTWQQSLQARPISHSCLPRGLCSQHLTLSPGLEHGLK